MPFPLFILLGNLLIVHNLSLLRRITPPKWLEMHCSNLAAVSPQKTQGMWLHETVEIEICIWSLQLHLCLVQSLALWSVRAVHPPYRPDLFALRALIRGRVSTSDSHLAQSMAYAARVQTLSFMLSYLHLKAWDVLRHRDCVLCWMCGTVWFCVFELSLYSVLM